MRPALSGWFGHDAPFAFEPSYRPASGVERMRVGTPPILALAALDAALDVWDGIDMAAVRARSIQLGELFIREVWSTCRTSNSHRPWTRRSGDRRCRFGTRGATR